VGKGERHRRERADAARASDEEARARAEEKARRDAFFATWSPEDGDAGPAFPCPECASFDRRWATPDEAAAALTAHDAAWGLAPAPDDDRRVAVCRACGASSVIP